MRSFDELARRLRVGVAVTNAELTYVDAEAKVRGDLATWMLLRAGSADELAISVARDFADAPDRAVIDGACGMGQTLRHAAWHVLADLAERRPSAISSIESAIASWPARARPWLRSWLEEAEGGHPADYHRLAENVGLQNETIDETRAGALLPPFDTLRELDLSSTTIAQSALTILGSLPRVEVLSLSRAASNDASAEVLANVELPSLRELRMSATSLTARGVACIMCSPRRTRLERLDVAGCNIDLVELARHLHEAPGTPRAIHLDLSECARASEGVVELARGPGLAWIAGLDLHHVEISVEAARALARASHALALRALSINVNSLGTDGVRALLEAPWIAGVTHLNLFNQHAGDTIGPALARLAAIEKLDLLHEDLGERAADALGHADLSRLRALHISYNPLGDRALAMIAANPTLTSLEVLEASGTGAGIETAQAIARATHFGKLRILDLGDKFSDDAVAAFASSSLPSLRRLKLIGASDTAIERLVEAPALARCFVTSRLFSDWQSCYP